ncbi:pre-peptidase C-terminal domain-containing protein [Asanoa ishikariensis]|uniref:Pre-peptidase C-terminal domain-containing protein n=1 Tax=Asanoa ishikariensis TaxID=137265 RepID=A0A1H3L4D0_9ACTN|nr:DVUA0089 family protein [Asanoa ishikariensis]SDY58774.1 pre-peptidase C-terminal domain-containing protein [Asanoa ishikariensis]
MRRTIALLAGTALVAAMLPASIATAELKNDSGPSGADRALLATGGQVADKAPAGKAPTGVNPYLALVPDPTTIDYAAWKQVAEKQGAAREQKRALRKAVAVSPVLVDEDEPDGTQGSNDSPAIAQPVSGFGTKGKQNPRARILGSLDNETVTRTALTPNTEDDGAIPLARDTGIQGTRNGITTSGTIGDGPHGSAAGDTGDFDFYKLSITQVGETMTADMDTPVGLLDPMLALYNAAGEEIAFNDDSGGLDSLLRFTFTAAGDYYLAVTGYNVLPADPFDSASGDGAGSEGAYNLLLDVAAADVDFYAVQLRKGDVLGTSVTGSAARITVWDTAGREVHGSDQDATFIYPPNSPLPGGGNAVSEHVADEDGLHYVSVSDGSGNYDITVEAYRPNLEGDKITQTIFIDFNGQRLNTAIFGGPGVVTLSPLRAFLGRWGLTTADENALINGIVAEVTENLKRDLVASGLNDKFRLKILNSRDDADPFGEVNVSRLIVGGTIAESGVNTIGIAQSIDPGNFDTQESALILLDVLSGPANDDASLNFYITPASDKRAFISQAVGNVVSHEAGHFFGNWHVDQFNDTLNLMDQGGNFPLLYGVGPDGIGGTADDPDVDFGEDEFNPSEGFTGTEDTQGRLATVLTR